MRKLIMSVAIAAFAIASIQAQENKTLKKESTIKREVTKEGSNVRVKETKSTDTESGAIIVEGNKKTNQEFNENTSKNISKEVLVDAVDIDQNNEASIARKKEIQQAELEKSKRNQEEMAAQKKREYDQKQLQMKKELADRRENLQARPKGMNKLRKD
ncbi:hypothetical protein [Aequorivita capsosiphonis]|uniref:hypothetical protein n=1 Tax=Aequorivita capsosiphonis TaxID=487317 RepID=UPI0004043354|nr:hypothetical protein [Aequorivita capsosiphonis]